MNRQLGLMIMVSVLLLGVIAGGLHLLTAQQPPRPQDPLARLKRALDEAGALPLTSQQEDQLRSLISEFQSTLPAPGQSPTPLAARRAYEDAVLNGDRSEAQAQANTVADEMANLTRTRLQAEASFVTQVLNVLKTNDDPIGALVKQQGNAGVFRLLRSLGMGAAGRWGGIGGHGPLD